MSQENMGKSVSEIIYPRHVLERFMRERTEEEMEAIRDEDIEEVSE